MKPTIEELLNSLGQTITLQLTAANDRAAAAEQKMSHLVNGLNALICADTPNTAVQARVISMKRSRSSIAVPDEAFFAVLTMEWIGAAEVRRILTAQGFRIAEGTVYNRMRKLAQNHDGIESAPKPERWRLTLIEGVEASSSLKPVGKKPKKVRSNSSLVDLTNASNDNGDCVHKPILYHGDCLEVMASMPDQSVDLILADLPYGVTRLPIDECLPTERLWEEYRRIVKPTGNIVLFGSQPFTTKLINAAPDLFKYSMVWEKTRATGYFHCRDRPLKAHEDILIFSPGTVMRKEHSSRRATFNPVGAEVVRKVLKAGQTVNYLDAKTHENGREYEGLINCPRSILKFAKDTAPRGKAHPFAKPMALLEFLIHSYSDANSVVLDNTMGSGSTCVAAMRTGRRSIGIELDQKWFEVAQERVMLEHGGSREIAVREVPLQQRAA